MNKRNYFTYPALLGTLFSVCLSSAVKLPNQVSTKDTITCAKRLGAQYSTVRGYEESQNAYTDQSFCCMHFITKKHLLALVEEPEKIQKIEYEIAPRFFMSMTIKSSSIIQEIEKYKLVLYELEKPIKEAVALKLPSPDETISNLLNKSYVFTYGTNLEASEEERKRDRSLKAISFAILSPSVEEEEEESEPVTADSFILTDEDIGCALVSKEEENSILVALGCSNKLRGKSTVFSYGGHSCFIPLSDEMLQEIERLVPELKSQDTSSSSTSSIRTNSTQEEEEETQTNRSTRQEGSVPPTLGTAVPLTNISSTSSPMTTELNLFDHPIEWKEGDEVTITSDGMWIVTHPDRSEDKRIGLVFPDMKPEEPLCFKVKKVRGIRTGTLLGSDHNIGYGIYIYGAVSKFLSDKDQIDVYANGWICTVKNGVQSWKYHAPQNPSFNKKRSYTKPGGLTRIFCVNGMIKNKRDGNIASKYPDRLTHQFNNGIIYIAYNNGSEELSLPNGMAFTKESKDSDWELKGSMEAYRNPGKSVSHTFSDGIKIIIYASDGRAEWIYDNGSKKVYSLDGNVTTGQANLFDDPTNWKEGDEVTILPDGTWRIKHCDGLKEKRIGLVPFKERPHESITFSITFKVTGIQRQKNLCTWLTSETDTIYRIYSTGIVEVVSPDKSTLEICTNGLTSVNKNGTHTWGYQDPQNPSLNKERSHTLPDKRIITVSPDQKVLTMPNGTTYIFDKSGRMRTLSGSRMQASVTPGVASTIPVPFPMSSIGLVPNPRASRPPMGVPIPFIGNQPEIPKPSPGPSNLFSAITMPLSPPAVTGMAHSNGATSVSSTLPSIPSTLLLGTNSQTSSGTSTPMGSEQTNGAAIYEQRRRLLLEKANSQLKTSPKNRPSTGKAEDEFLKLTVFRHGVTHEIDKTGLTEFTERVTFGQGLCLTKKRGQSSYTCSQCQSSEKKLGWYEYPLGTRESCLSKEAIITIRYPDNKRLKIDCHTGFVQLMNADSKKELKSGYFFGSFRAVLSGTPPRFTYCWDAPTVTFDWSEDNGLTASFISPAPTPSTTSGDDTTIHQISTTTTSTTQKGSSSPTSGAVIIDITDSYQGSEKAVSINLAEEELTKLIELAEEKEPTNGTKRKRDEGSSSQTVTPSPEEDSPNKNSKNRKRNIPRKQKATEENPSEKISLASSSGTTGDPPKRGKSNEGEKTMLVIDEPEEEEEKD